MSEETARLLPLPPSLAVSSSLSSRRPASTTVKPALISASDAARPTPVPAPFTIAILFFVSVIYFLPFSSFWFCFSFVGGSWNILMRRAQRRRPARPQIVEVRLARFDAVIEIGVADVVSHHQHVDRQADAEIGAHR